MINVVFASGIIRTLERFKHSIVDFRNNPNVDRIVLSVWYGQVDMYEGLRSFLADHDVQVIESKEPSQVKTGFIIHQMKSISESLKLFEDTDLLFKTRCDFYIDQKFFNKLVDGHAAWSIAPQNEFKLFSKRIWVMYFEYTKPFFLGDEAFCGLKKDINYLINYENYEKYDIGNGITHIRRYIDPFLKKYPILEKYLHISNSFASLNQKQRFNLIKQHYHKAEFSIFYYLFIKIMSANYYVDYPNIDVTSVYYDSKNRIQNDKFISNFRNRYVNCDRGGHIFVFEQAVIDKLEYLQIDHAELPCLLKQLLEDNVSYDQVAEYSLTKKFDFPNKGQNKKFRSKIGLKGKIHRNKYFALMNEIKKNKNHNGDYLPSRNLFIERIKQKIKRI